MKKKILIFAAICGLIGLFFLVDCLVLQFYTVDIVSISPETSVADGKTPVTITVSVKKNGQPVEGHILYMLSKSGGSLKSNRIATNTKGEAEFVYYPYLASNYLKAGDVMLRVEDESNSIFVSVPASKDFTVKLTDPASTSNTEPDYLTDDIFGE